MNLASSGDGEFCDNCGEPTTPLAGDSITNTCETCGKPVNQEDSPEWGIGHDDEYKF